MYYPPSIDSIKGTVIDDVGYSLNEVDKTATVILCPIRNIDVPKSIKYESQEYIVTSIVGGAFTDICGYFFFTRYVL